MSVVFVGSVLVLFYVVVVVFLVFLMLMEKTGMMLDLLQTAQLLFEDLLLLLVVR